jgi:sugar phosphate isomerase/epimerase
MNGSVTIGVTGWSLGGNGGACLKIAASAGFGAIQIGINGPGDCRKLSSSCWVDPIRRASLAHMVAVTAVALNVLEEWGIGESPADAGRRRALALVRSGARTARDLGATLVYVPSFGQNRMDGPRSVERTAGFLQPACRIAADHGLELASENTLGLADNLLLVDSVQDAAFRILIDTYNPVLWGYDTAELILGLQPYLASQAHVKDGVGGVMGSAPLGAGEGRTGVALRAFSAVGYTGTFFLENDYRGEKLPRAAADIRYLRDRQSIPIADARMRTSAGGL